MFAATQPQLPWLPPSASTFADRLGADLLVHQRGHGRRRPVGVRHDRLLLLRVRPRGRQPPADAAHPRLDQAGGRLDADPALLLPDVLRLGGEGLQRRRSRSPADAPEYFVVGKQWMWKIQHPDGQREINELHLPVNTTGQDHRHLRGRDPRLRHPGVPVARSTWSPAGTSRRGTRRRRTGTYHIFCDQYCGMGHSQMVGKVHVLSQDRVRGLEARASFQVEAGEADRPTGRRRGRAASCS